MGRVAGLQSAFGTTVMTDRQALERIREIIIDGDEYVEIVEAIEVVLDGVLGRDNPPGSWR